MARPLASPKVGPDSENEPTLSPETTISLSQPSSNASRVASTPPRTEGRRNCRHKHAYDVLFSWE
eukprot:6890536-Alexandrium_andersonii.AAC.1